jgi:hypothetical protein
VRRAPQKSRSARTASRASLASTPSSSAAGAAPGSQPHAARGSAAAACTSRGGLAAVRALARCERV